MPERRENAGSPPDGGHRGKDVQQAIEQERRAGGGATVAGRGDRDDEAVEKGLERLEQAGGN